MFEKPVENIPTSEKTAQWEQILGRIDAMKDRLGKGVDENIKETVAAFMVNELPTRQSCEGHLEERSGEMKKIAPYVDVAGAEPKERFVGESEMKKKIAERFGISPDKIAESDVAGAAYWDYISQNQIEETPEYQEARRRNEALKQKALGLMDEFYRQRSPEESKALHVVDIGPSGRFRIEGATRFVKEVPHKDVERRRTELAREQAEMAALTEFLKEKFFKA